MPVLCVEFKSASYGDTLHQRPSARLTERVDVLGALIRAGGRIVCGPGPPLKVSWVYWNTLLLPVPAWTFLMWELCH
jgi:hypothetical protein